MAKTVTLQNLRDAVRLRGEYRDPFITDTELDSYINDSLAALYDLLAEGDPQRYATYDDIVVSAGTDEYSLPAAFYKLVAVHVADSSLATGYYPLDRIAEAMLHRDNVIIPTTEKRCARYYLRANKLIVYPSPSWSGTIRVWYIPALTSLSSPSDTFDTVNLWHEWVVLDVLVKCALKARDEERGWERQREKTEARITSRMEADCAEPKTVTDVEWGYSRRHGRPRVWRR